MAPLRLLALAAALFAATPAHADPVARWRPYIAEASTRFGVPSAWIERVMRAESGGMTTFAGRPTTSRAGAMGLMQIMPATWAELRATLRLGTDPHDPRDNIMAGTYYLRLMHDRFGYPGAFAAYNAGPARYADYLAKRRALPGETITYLASVTGQASLPATPLVRAAPPAAPSLFFMRAASSEPQAKHGATPLPAVASIGLFVPLNGTTDRVR